MDLKDLRTGFLGLKSKIPGEKAWAWLSTILGS
jgi:hypothetical protein